MHTLALTPDELRTVTQLLGCIVPEHSAMAFGSRVRPAAHTTHTKPLKPHADLDIALTGPALAPHHLFALRDAFSESDLPFRVDISMRGDLPLQWRDSIAWAALKP